LRNSTDTRLADDYERIKRQVRRANALTTAKSRGFLY
jgi:hypothetical protein